MRKIVMKAGLLALCLLVVVAGFVMYTNQVMAGFPGENGRIVYSQQDEELDHHLFTVKPDGTGVVDLDEEGGDPVFSPDGSKIAYVKLGDEDNAIWTMNKDGSNETEIYSPDSGDALIDITWSPDGEMIAFEHIEDFGGDNESDIMIVPSDGSSAPTDLEGAAEADIAESDPHWDPSSNTIVFARLDDEVDSGNGRIYSIDADGGTPTSLAASIGDDLRHPQFSPDGETIVYVNVEAVDVGGLPTESYLYTMTSAGASEAQLTDAVDGVEWDPSFSPDGEQIVFHTGAPGGLAGPQSEGELEVIDADGSNQQALNVSNIEEPDWGQALSVVVEPECTTQVGKKCSSFDPDVPEICQVAGLKPDSGAFGATVTSGGFGYQPSNNTAGTQEFSYQVTDDDTMTNYTCNFLVTFIPKSPDTGDAPKSQTPLYAAGASFITAGGYLGLRKLRSLRR